MPPRKARSKNDSYKRSGALIADAREAKDLTQQQLADRLKISRQRLQHWEAGAAMPRPAEMGELAAELNLTVDEITRGERAPPQQSLELDPSAQTIGKAWASAPRAGQAHVAELLHSMIKFREEHPDLAAQVFKEPSPTEMQRLKEHEKMLELLQEISRRKAVKPPEEE